jgi:hypothetical protein
MVGIMPSLSKHTTIHILTEHSWEEVEAELRGVTLIGDPSIKPYEHAQMELKVVQPADVAPLSLYAIKENIATQRYLHELFLAQHHIDTLNLDGVKTSLVYRDGQDPEEWVMAPPIIEESPLDGKPVLVDGEHRFLLAKELGVPIKSVWIKGVSANTPVVATPLDWSEVTIYDEVPDTFKKRHYRYPTFENFPDISSWSKAKVTPENYLYFFYRDLSGICSSGIRATGAKSNKKS